MSRGEKGRQIQQALMKIAKADPALSINQLRVLLALERIVARLTNHKILGNHLIFKGGFVLLKVIESQRFTRDLDALAHGILREDVPVLIIEALEIYLDDGFWFGEPTVEELDEQGEYGGLRLSSAFQLGEPPKEMVKQKKLSRIHIDISFGDIVRGVAPQSTMLSIVSEFRPLAWKVYPLEWIVSEKIETLVARGSANSRAKDLYDLATLIPKIEDQSKLKKAIDETFAIRNTNLPASLEKYMLSIDTTFLQNSWKSVELGDIALTFEECFTQLIGLLREFDAKE